VAQDRAFKRRRHDGTTLARPWQIDREVERDFAILISTRSARVTVSVMSWVTR
jgi:hypothetical protein